MSQNFALLLSIGIETAVAILLAHRMAWGRLVGAGLAAAFGTLITHPLVWHGIDAGADLIGYWPALVGVELAAALIESLFYRLLATDRWRYALMLSGAANLASLGFGLALYAFDLA